MGVTTDTDLCAAAVAAAANAYAPYSSFRVGAAVQTSQGIFAAANVENASYGLTLCAERAALAVAVAHAATDVSAIAIACVDADPTAPIGSQMPCGACRQWMSELAPRARILICGSDREFTVAQLLPMPFEL